MTPTRRAAILKANRVFARLLETHIVIWDPAPRIRHELARQKDAEATENRSRRPYKERQRRQRTG